MFQTQEWAFLINAIIEIIEMLLLENTSVVIIFCRVCDVINFEIKFSFLIKPVFLHNQKVRPWIKLHQLTTNKFKRVRKKFDDNSLMGKVILREKHFKPFKNQRLALTRKSSKKQNMKLRS